MTYYYCSRSRRGFEYQLATRYFHKLMLLTFLTNICIRAVKFIRDQELLRDQSFFGADSTDVPKGAAGVAQAAVQALRKSLNRDYEPEGIADILDDPVEDSPPFDLEPLEGWSHGVSLKRSHFCVLLKPQIVLHSESSVESTCVLTAGLAKLHVNGIMDDSNMDDPICGKIMSRYVKKCFIRVESN
jgi:RNA pol II promoter Fmp27 protein domain